ncbi:Hypothetical_protein [Hexamita inflata]|uniref:Hypothetical_protein n=1 Tax=Hexamita inflata TaxID=28002 RepID=A0AA86PCP9_9EUKA|nr:Hypothetical protein HINF_LOCUS23051 [Hexamita inflata]
MTPETLLMRVMFPAAITQLRLTKRVFMLAELEDCQITFKAELTVIWLPDFEIIFMFEMVMVVPLERRDPLWKLLVPTWTFIFQNVVCPPNSGEIVEEYTLSETSMKAF